MTQRGTNMRAARLLQDIEAGAWSWGREYMLDQRGWKSTTANVSSRNILQFVQREVQREYGYN